MYRLHNTSEHSGVTNMYSLSNAGGGSSRSNTPIPQIRQQQQHQQQQQQHQQPHYILDNDQVSLMQQQQQHHFGTLGNTNGGISHSYTLPHNLSHHQQALSAANAAASTGTLKEVAVSYNPQHHRMHHTLQRHCEFVVR
jgi:hypothetical protein